MKSHFEDIFDEYHDLIRKEIARDTDLDNKLSKVEQLVFLMDSVISNRLSEEYHKQAKWFQEVLKKGTYLDKENNQINVSYNQPQTKRQRLSLLREWLSLMLQNEPRFKLYGNINRVKFGD